MEQRVRRYPLRQTKAKPSLLRLKPGLEHEDLAFLLVYESDAASRRELTTIPLGERTKSPRPPDFAVVWLSDHSWGFTSSSLATGIVSVCSCRLVCSYRFALFCHPLDFV